MGPATHQFEGSRAKVSQVRAVSAAGFWREVFRDLDRWVRAAGEYIFVSGEYAGGNSVLDVEGASGCHKEASRRQDGVF